MDNVQNSQAVRGKPNEVSEETQKQKQLEQEIAKNSILTQVMDQSALARLNNIAAAKPEKAKALENLVIQLARSGQIREKLTDQRLRQLLDQISEKTSKTTTVKFDRRRNRFDDSDDE